VLAQAFSGLIAAGVFSGMSGAGGVAGWQWLFILEAALSAFFALTAFFVLPNYPHSKTGGQMWSMTEDMRRIAVARIEADRVEAHTDSTVWQGLRLALADVKTYVSARVRGYTMFMLTQPTDIHLYEHFYDIILWLQ
jgi:MFS family permease